MSNGKRIYPYIPNSVPEVKAEMLKEVGANDIMDLYEEIPDNLKFKGKLNIPDPLLDEYSLKRHLEGLLSKNKHGNEYINFLGAGCYQHFVPAVCDEINGRGEFLTAYVGESYADHGKWQAFFEYSSLMAELLDMETLSVPMYDGAQAAATSIRMAARINGRSKVIIPKSINPEIRMVINNYIKPEISVTEVDFDEETGLVDIDDLRRKISSETIAVFIQNPSYLGVLECQAEQIGKIADEYGTGLTLHQSNRPRTIQHHLTKFGERPVEYLKHIGLLGSNVLLAHVTGLNSKEIDLFRFKDDKISEKCKNVCQEIFQ